MLSPIEGSHATVQEKTRLAFRLSRNDTRIQKDESGASANSQLSWVTFSRRFSHGRPHNAAMRAPVRMIMSGNNSADSGMSINRGKIDLPVYIVIMRISKKIAVCRWSGCRVMRILPYHTDSVLVSFACSNKQDQGVAKSREDNTDTSVPSKNNLLRSRVGARNALKNDPGGHPGAALQDFAGDAAHKEFSHSGKASPTHHNGPVAVVPGLVQDITGRASTSVHHLFSYLRLI